MSEAPSVRDESAIATGVDWERLWLATQRRSWTTLALIPVGGDIPTPRVAAALAEVGKRHLGRLVLVSDATTVTIEEIRELLGVLGVRARGVERVIVALPEVRKSPAALALAQAADAVILCITLGSSVITEAEQIVAEVGRDRVLGSVIIRETKEKR